MMENNLKRGKKQWPELSTTKNGYGNVLLAAT
jgi:hypothetical protein